MAWYCYVLTVMSQNNAVFANNDCHAKEISTNWQKAPTSLFFLSSKDCKPFACFSSSQFSKVGLSLTFNFPLNNATSLAYHGSSIYSRVKIPTMNQSLNDMKKMTLTTTFGATPLQVWVLKLQR